jgi:hypothetical protein
LDDFVETLRFVCRGPTVINCRCPIDAFRSIVTMESRFSPDVGIEHGSLIPGHVTSVAVFVEGIIFPHEKISQPGESITFTAGSLEVTAWVVCQTFHVNTREFVESTINLVIAPDGIRHLRGQCELCGDAGRCLMTGLLCRRCQVTPVADDTAETPDWSWYDDDSWWPDEHDQE